MYVKCVSWLEIYLEFPVRAANMAVNINNQDTNWYLLCYNAFLENFDCFICCMYLKDVHRKLSKSISFSFKRHFMLSNLKIWDMSESGDTWFSRLSVFRSSPQNRAGVTLLITGRHLSLPFPSCVRFPGHTGSIIHFNCWHCFCPGTWQ